MLKVKTFSFVGRISYNFELDIDTCEDEDPDEPGYKEKSGKFFKECDDEVNQWIEDNNILTAQISTSTSYVRIGGADEYHYCVTLMYAMHTSR